MDVQTLACELTVYASDAELARIPAFVARRSSRRNELEDVENALEVRVGWRRAGSRRIYPTARVALDREQCPAGDLRIAIVIIAGRRRERNKK